MDGAEEVIMLSASLSRHDKWQRVRGLNPAPCTLHPKDRMVVD
jgi:hypothetical protein